LPSQSNGGAPLESSVCNYKSSANGITPLECAVVRSTQPVRKSKLCEERAICKEITSWKIFNYKNIDYFK
jgi:hypothetical protein